MSSEVISLVSVRFMVYNNEPFIREAVESILMQKTEFNVEIIVGDDFSTDNTLEIIRSYKNTEKISIRILDRPIGGEYWLKRKNKNGSVRTNFIDIIENCHGKYIALLDGDDYWTDPLKLQKQVDFLEKNLDYSVCFHPCVVVNNQNKKQIITKQSLNDIDYKYNIKNLLNYWNIPSTAIIFRNDSSIQVPDWFFEVASGDIALLMLFFEKGKFKLLKDYMSVYRITGGGVSNTHNSYKMIYYRAKLYTYLNEYFEFKYEKEIYDALNDIYQRHSDKIAVNNKKAKQSFRVKFLNKFFK